MMKKYGISSLFCILFMGVSLCSVNPHKYKLLTAIKNNDVAKVQILLSDNPIFDTEDTKCLLDAAEESLKQREKSISVFKSGRDFLASSCGLGAVWGGGGCLVVSFFAYFFPSEIAGQIKRDRTIFSEEEVKAVIPHFLCYGILASACGIYLLERGLTCKSAENFLKNAQEIKKLIKKVSSME
ncbi:hypothetical protein H0X06_05705 [Candidatus Dependentiae bacterium]|nr:hypothetical protein [Candidatus Dependentiae bacterium]